jgi:hypothetical protein
MTDTPEKKTPAKKTAFKAPVSPAKITCEYGKKGALWAAGYHTGVDYAAKQMQSVTAVADGIVLAAYWGPAYGIHVIVQHGKYRYLYAHLAHKNSNITPGTAVKQGQQLGGAGATGNARGVHVHLEARVAPYRYAIDTVDPTKALDK